MQANTIKSLWNDGAAGVGLWLTTADLVAAEITGAMDVDYLVIDMQHGVIDYRDVAALLAAIQRSNATPLVRVPWNEPGILGKVLDAGAMGVIVPMVNSAAEAEQAVAACRYAPAGRRSYGPVRAGAALGPNYPSEANDEVAVIVMVETTQALANLDAIVAVPGVDAVYVGPADLSLTLGLPPAGAHDDATFNTALKSIVDACGKAGIPAGIHANPGVSAQRLAEGFRMVTLTSDLSALEVGWRAAIQAAGR